MAFTKYYITRRFDKLGVAYRENVSVPKGSKGAGKVVTVEEFEDGND